MDMSTITSLISNLGFPIIACVFMGKYLLEFSRSNEKTILDITEKHNEEMKQIVDALNNNTNAINLLSEKLGGEK